MSHLWNSRCKIQYFYIAIQLCSSCQGFASVCP